MSNKLKDLKNHSLLQHKNNELNIYPNITEFVNITDKFKIISDLVKPKCIMEITQQIADTFAPIQKLTDAMKFSYLNIPSAWAEKKEILKDDDGTFSDLLRSIHQSRINGNINVFHGNELPLQIITKDETALNDKYIEEKRKGGQNSYKINQPLRSKVEEICKQELLECSYKSALNLCNTIAQIIERDHIDLLNNFAPYVKSKINCSDWRSQTFYSWCKTIYQLHKK